ncbi:MAG: hypothetical protein KJ915_03200 [Candidatus Omnitrophica bacterium]|nr:hypothetical protein [Candidatus Omnitrophota bacterium]
MKYIAIVVLILFVIISTPYVAYSSSDVEDDLDEIAYIDLQVSAVTTEMYKFIGWLPDEKEWMKEAAPKAVRDLEQLKSHLQIIDLPRNLSQLKKLDIKIIDTLKAIYTDIDKKEDKEIEDAFALLDKQYSKYQERLRKAFKKYKQTPKLPPKFEPIDEEIKLTNNEKDREAYLKAVKFIDEGELIQGYEELKALDLKYEGTPFGNCIRLRMTRCWLTFDEDICGGIEDPFKESFKVFSKIMNRSGYSPILYETFDRWRTTYQGCWGGMSNTSNIYNKKYNEKRWQIVQTIKKYLKKNPDDVWAKAQISLLMAIPNITRGGSLGNTNINYWGNLYPDILSKEGK